MVEDLQETNYCKGWRVEWWILRGKRARRERGWWIEGRWAAERMKWIREGGMEMQSGVRKEWQMKGETEIGWRMERWGMQEGGTGGWKQGRKEVKGRREGSLPMCAEVLMTGWKIKSLQLCSKLMLTSACKYTGSKQILMCNISGDSLWMIIKVIIMGIMNVCTKCHGKPKVVEIVHVKYQMPPWCSRGNIIKVQPLRTINVCADPDVAMFQWKSENLGKG